MMTACLYRAAHTLAQRPPPPEPPLRGTVPSVKRATTLTKSLLFDSEQSPETQGVVTDVNKQTTRTQNATNINQVKQIIQIP